MSYGLDFLAIVSRPDLPIGTGPAGDYFALHDLVAAHPRWRSLVLELNHHDVDVSWQNNALQLTVSGHHPVNLSEVNVALFVPASLEIEETQLARIDPTGPWPRFAVENWRPVSAYVEACLNRQRCLNRPNAVRAANNKLIQFDTLRRAGFTLPLTTVRRGFPTAGPLAEHASLVVKNVSEGGWKSPTEFSPARLVERPTLPGTVHDPDGERWPTIWQEPLSADRELRMYVMGREVTAVELVRDPDVVDVRATNDGRPRAKLTELRDDWRAIAVAMTGALGLDYAVLDTMPVDDTLHVLEVNANGVWWFLPPDVGATLEERFHAWITSEVDAAKRF